MAIRRRVVDKQHRWLSQVDLSGVVLSEPVLAEAAPAGFRNLEKRELAQFYKAREVWNLPPGMVQGDPEAQWVAFILEQLLRLGPTRWQVGASIAARFVISLSQQRETLRPTRVLLDGADGVLVFLRVPRTQSLDAPWDTGGSWKASPTTKVERLLRESGVEVGLVTNGEAWRLVIASPSETAAWLTWTTQTWADSPSTLSAFVDLLGDARFFAGPKSGTILELVRASRERQADVAELLGTQVRQALELFVRELDRVDASVNGDLLRQYSDDEIFEAAASLLMRLVFLLKAEESGLLPHGSMEYDRSYGVLHLLTRLERAHRFDPEKLFHSNEGYAQLLATVRIVHAGSSDADINVGAYGGELFNPEKYPLLEGRTPDGRWLKDPRLKPLPIRDSVMLEMLRRLKYARGAHGAVQWVSYRTLEIEQLGHMYEGLLDLRLRRGPTESGILLLTPTDKVASPVIAIDQLLDRSSKEVCAALAKATGRPIAEIKSAMEKVPQQSAEQGSRIPEGLPAALAPVARFVRAAGMVRPGGLYIDFGNRRHDQGAVYTPTSITEPMIRRALEPLVIARSGDRQVRTAREILSLRVCDPAMGSAAFLVQAVRFLAERVVDVWDAESAGNHGVALTMPYASVSDGHPGELLMPESREERVLWARRFVAERCVYGVDINPLAVEMAKLSLWLATASPTKPFTFLDHVLRSGNAVLGADLQQIRTWSLDRKGDSQPLFATLLESTIAEAVRSRHTLSRLTGRATEAERRRRLKDAEMATARLAVAADVLISASLTLGDDTLRATRVSSALARVTSAQTDNDWKRLNSEVRGELGAIRPFHWYCEFPDVFSEGDGFDAVLGNPPYVRQELLSPIKPLLKRAYNTFDGAADLYVYFYELGVRLLRAGGILCLITNNKWLRAGYGKPLRTFLATDTRIETIVDFGHARKIFKDVDVFPCIVLLRKPAVDLSARATADVCVIDRDQLRLDDLHEQIKTDGFTVPVASFSEGPWYLESASVRRLLRLIESSGKPLSSVVGPPRRGITTGLTEAFVVDQQTRDKLVDEDHACDAVLRRFVRGRDIERWSCEWVGQWMILLKSSENQAWPWAQAGAGAEDIFRKTLPSLYEHLLPWKARLQARSDKGRYWWELRSCAYYEALDRPKIILHRYMYHSSFALLDADVILNDASSFLPADSWVLAVLNSPLFWWYAFRVFPHKKDETIAMDQALISVAPIPTASNELKAAVASYVGEIVQGLTDSQGEWMRLGCDLRSRLGDEAGALALKGARSGARGLLAAVKKVDGLDRALALERVNDLRGVADTLVQAAQGRSRRRRELEVLVSDAVFQAYKLSESDIQMVWDTAPPRTPLAADTDGNSVLSSVQIETE